jgi:neopullulanase
VANRSKKLGFYYRWPFTFVSMNFARKTTLMLVFLCCLQVAKAQVIDPPFWYAGMPNDTLMLMMHGAKLNDAKDFKCNNTNVQLISSEKSGDYTFLQLKLNAKKDIAPVEITWLNSGKKENLTYNIYNKNSAFKPQGIDVNDMVYLVMPDRFASGSDDNDFVKGMEQTDRTKVDARHGGDLQGVQNNLKYISKLGATAVWLTPVVEMNQPQGSYHHYGASDFYGIDARFATGKTADRNANNLVFKNYVQNCHANKLKVVMDVVTNHCGIDHHWTKNKTPKDWYHAQVQCNFMIPALTDKYALQSDIDGMEKGWFVPSMPDLNHDNPLMCKYLIQNTLWWIEYAELDALRLDTQPFSKKEFLSEWSNTIKQAYPSITIVGETWSASNNQAHYIDYWQANNNNKDGYNSAIESVMNFPWWEKAVQGLKTNDANAMYYTMTNNMNNSNAEKNYILLGNHDTERFFTTIEKSTNKFYQGVLMLATMPGIPQWYYGDELGFEGVKGINDGLMRADMLGGFKGDKQDALSSQIKLDAEQLAKHNFCTKFFNYRKGTNAWRKGKFAQAIPQDNVYSYVRYSDKNCYVLFINFSAKPQNCNLARFNEILKDYPNKSEEFAETHLYDKVLGNGYSIYVFEK